MESAGAITPDMEAKGARRKRSFSITHTGSILGHAALVQSGLGGCAGLAGDAPWSSASAAKAFANLVELLEKLGAPTAGDAA